MASLSVSTVSTLFRAFLIWS